MTAKITGFITRAEAGLRPPRSISRRITPKAGGVASHYGGGPQSCAFEGASHNVCLEVWRSWQNYHMNSHGWADVAYTGAYCNHGYAFAGRGVGVRTAAQGTSAGNQNFYAIVWLGGGRQIPTEAARDAFEWWVLTLREAGAGWLVKPHKFFKATACPGKAITATSMLMDGKPLVAASRPQPPVKPPAKPVTPSEPWRDKIVVAKAHVRFYNTPGWYPRTRHAGILKPGYGFRGAIHEKRKVGRGYQYLVSNSNGHRYWITANERYISLRSKN